ncbi:hypothetical protein BV22DRAFT_1039973 [Leucogyrophana mollusca]|uniref:Uncharacterized protein n=1 Tax=Leucogyrophana mollusca TaxID=85980 RepID=A0ACB8B634_9AGAM|nr:hypothetical protein BV22DRAFT_1039973 [Leucogyrophana mollusca]
MVSFKAAPLATVALAAVANAVKCSNHGDSYAFCVYKAYEFDSKLGSKNYHGNSDCGKCHTIDIHPVGSFVYLGRDTITMFSGRDCTGLLGKSSADWYKPATSVQGRFMQSYNVC